VVVVVSTKKALCVPSNLWIFHRDTPSLSFETLMSQQSCCGEEKALRNKTGNNF